MELEVAGQRFSVICMNPKFLLNRIEIDYLNNYYIATPTRAMADILYHSPNYYFDNLQAINTEELTKLRRELNFVIDKLKEELLFFWDR